ncbi:AAA family ATPase, partial [Nonomuraea sp. NPDC005983]|uniref:ATP-binding protein n=1 Tax=Nonomuraea sp. NPDC005983 TaxID=3155595 RepID=UPI0033A49147
MLYGRAAETTAIDDLISSASSGHGRALVLRGEAGVGKSALLDLAASRAGSLRVLRASGAEPESGLAYAALHQLLRPVTGLLDALPKPQRDAVSGALGLAAPAGDRFLVAAGALSLLVEAAAPDGLLCLVDDFQWFDRASADALLFAARRLRTERVGLLLAVRGDAHPAIGTPADMPRRHVSGHADPRSRADTAAGTVQPDVVEVRVGGLDAGSAAELLDSVAEVSAGTRARLVALTGGNPLVLRETAALLTPEQLSGRAPLPDPLPGGEQLFGRQVARLSGDARLVTLVAALDADLALVLRTAELLGADPAALHEAETSGLVSVSGATIRFRHPLVRSAVHASASSVELRRAHAVLADLVDGDRRAWHLAAATVGQDAQVADALAASAAGARSRGGFGDAATALARSAELTPATSLRAERLKDAAVAAWLGGRPGQAESYLAEARDLATAPSGQSLLEEIAQLRGRFELNSGDAAEAMRILASGESLAMLADASEAASYVGDVAALVELGRRARAFAPGFLRDVVAGIGAMLDDGSGGELLRAALARTGELREAAEFLWASAAASYLGEADVSAELADRAGRVARMSGMVGQLPVVLEFVSTAERIRGRLAESAAVAEEGLTLAREAGYINSVAAHLANLAVVAALRGEEDACRSRADEALAIAIPHRVGLRAGVASYALAMLDLGLGRFAAAHSRFVAITEAGPGAGHPTVVWRSTPDRVEAAVAADEPEAARAALAGLERWSADAATSEARALL